jgi:hypothetical protein
MKFQKSNIDKYSFTEKELDPVNELADTNQLGGACTINNLLPTQYTSLFEKYGIPIGLVLDPISSLKRGGHTENESIYFNQTKNKNEIPGIIDNQYFDKIYSMTHKNIPYMSNKTQKQNR